MAHDNVRINIIYIVYNKMRKISSFVTWCEFILRGHV